MKVVLFCGGAGLRLRDYSERIPKPMANIGYRPILWHVMKYYAHFGHKDFILCLGYKADYIKDYFLKYNECVSNDFVLSAGGHQLELLSSDIDDWKITFVDTGLDANIGQRLAAVKKYLAGEEVFLANYSDGLSDAPLPELLDDFMERDTTASFLCVRPPQSFHVVSIDDHHDVTDIRPMNQCDIWVNGGYFILRNDIFDYLRDGEELIQQPFQRLIDQHRLIAYKYEGFWMSMDTFKDKQQLDDMYAHDQTPWEIWKTQPTPAHVWTPRIA